MGTRGFDQNIISVCIANNYFPWYVKDTKQINVLNFEPTLNMFNILILQ